MKFYIIEIDNTRARHSKKPKGTMNSRDSRYPIYDEVEIEDMKFDPIARAYTYPCPCGDLFILTLDEMEIGEDIATCPSCTLRLRVIYDEENENLRQYLDKKISL